MCVSVISVSLLESDMLPGLESLREDLEASQPDKVVSTLHTLNVPESLYTAFCPCSLWCGY